MKLPTLQVSLLAAALAGRAALAAQAPDATITITTNNAEPSPPQAGISASTVSSLRIAVDARVELMSLVFRLAGYPEYNEGRVKSYREEVEKQFGGFREHAVVKLARQLRRSQGISCDACMSLAVLLTDVSELKTKVALEPWPESLDRRWTAESASNFLAAARQFAKETAFRDFLERHRPLYRTTESRLRALVEKEGHLEWFQEFFGERPQAVFVATPALLNGGSSYGPHFRDAAGQEELFCILGVWRTDADGLPEFTRDMLRTVVHEFCHSQADPVIDRHLDEMRPAGETLFRHVAKTMRSQGYGNPGTMLRESLVRACVVSYLRHFDNAQAAEQAIREQKGRGFLWMAELSNLLNEYEAHRSQYPTLEAFSPRLVAFFKEYAAAFAKKQAALEAHRPKVVSRTLPDGATAVDPGLISQPGLPRLSTPGGSIGDSLEIGALTKKTSSLLLAGWNV